MDHATGRIRLDRMLFTSTRYHVPEFDRLEIQHFFEVYKEIEPGRSVQGAAWADRAAAEPEIESCRKRAAESARH